MKTCCALQKERPLVFFFKLLLYPGESTPDIGINTIALFHFLKTELKYEFCDTHTFCSGGADCQEISPGNYLLVFFAFGGKV